MKQLIDTARRSLLDLVFPPSCVSCDRELPDLGDGESPSFCSDCLAEMPIYAAPFCPRCGCSARREMNGGCPACLSDRFRFDEAIALGGYDGILRQLLLRMKKGSDESISLAVGRLMWDTCRERLAAAGPDLVVPIPMYWSRRLGRGTNSAVVLAEVFSDRLGVPLEVSLLRRRRNTLLQSGLPPRERNRNLRDALAVRVGYALRGAGVLVVDDIMTTGATANAAARALHQAGAGHVAVAVVARSSADPDAEVSLLHSAGSRE